MLLFISNLFQGHFQIFRQLLAAADQFLPRNWNSGQFMDFLTKILHCGIFRKIEVVGSNIVLCSDVQGGHFIWNKVKCNSSHSGLEFYFMLRATMPQGLAYLVSSSNLIEQYPDKAAEWSI